MYLENVKAYKADYSDWKQDTASLKDIDIVSLKLNLVLNVCRQYEVYGSEYFTGMWSIQKSQTTVLDLSKVS